MGLLTSNNINEPYHFYLDFISKMASPFEKVNTSLQHTDNRGNRNVRGLNMAVKSLSSKSRLAWHSKCVLADLPILPGAPVFPFHTRSRWPRTRSCCHWTRSYSQTESRPMWPSSDKKGKWFIKQDASHIAAVVRDDSVWMLLKHIDRHSINWELYGGCEIA